MQQLPVFSPVLRQKRHAQCECKTKGKGICTSEQDIDNKQGHLRRSPVRVGTPSREKIEQLVGAALPRLGDVLTSLFFQRPELRGLILTEVPLLHRNLHERALDTLAHALAAATDEDPSIKTIDDPPH